MKKFIFIISYIYKNLIILHHAVYLLALKRKRFSAYAAEDVSVTHFAYDIGRHLPLTKVKIITEFLGLQTSNVVDTVTI